MHRQTSVATKEELWRTIKCLVEDEDIPALAAEGELHTSRPFIWSFLKTEQNKRVVLEWLDSTRPLRHIPTPSGITNEDLRDLRSRLKELVDKAKFAAELRSRFTTENL